MSGGVVVWCRPAGLIQWSIPPRLPAAAPSRSPMQHRTLTFAKYTRNEHLTKPESHRCTEAKYVWDGVGSTRTTRQARSVWPTVCTTGGVGATEPAAPTH